MSNKKNLSRREILKNLTLGVGGLAVLNAGTPRAMASEEDDDDCESTYTICEDHLITRLTEDYGLTHPFVSAGMAFVALEDLVVAVSEAGGLGVLGAAPEPPDIVQARIQTIKSRTNKDFGVDFIISSANGQDFTTQAHIDVAIAEAVPVVIFHFGVPSAAWVNALHAAGSKVWVQCENADIAAQALAVCCDGIIAQGKEGGGHNRSTIKQKHLVEEIREDLDPPLLLAAGGIAKGKALAKALERGADGVWVGTRMVASVEAHAHPEYKSRIVNGGEDATVYTTLFGPEWPDQRQQVLRNTVTNTWAGCEDQIPNPPPGPAQIGDTLLFPGIANVPYPMPKFSAMVPTLATTGDFEEMDMPAGGKSVKKIKSVMYAADIIDDMIADAIDYLV